jgi:hypothetical protein
MAACWAIAAPQLQAQSQITAKDAWVRAAPSAAMTSAAFMVLHNAAARDAAVVSARSPAARIVEIHETRDDDGIMRMRRVDALTVPARGSVTLKPGSYHLMLINLTAPLRPGTSVTVTLAFSDGSTLDVAATVRPLS